MFLSKYRAFYHVGFLGKPMQTTFFFNILDRKKKLFRAEKLTLKKCVKNLHFLMGLVHGSCQKMELFTMCAFLANQGRKDHFFNIFWIERNCFQTRKVKFQKRANNRILKMGQSMVFVKKLSFLPCGIFRQTKAEKIVFSIFWIEKNTFQRRKENFQKWVKNQNFFEGLGTAQ